MFELRDKTECTKYILRDYCKQKKWHDKHQNSERNYSITVSVKNN